MIYFFLGEDGERKDAKIAELKQQCLSREDALLFDYDVFYGNEIDLPTLKKSLISLPAVSPQRLILIHSCHKLSKQHQDMVLDFAQSRASHAVLVLESSEWTGQNEFVRKLGSGAKVQEFVRPQKKNVFDMTRLMNPRQAAEALKILADLFAQGTHPLQILGGLVWFWGRQRERMDREQYKQGLRTLQEADYNIKRSRLDPGHAIEMTVVKLCAILK